jgi:hypothetical protein
MRKVKARTSKNSPDKSNSPTIAMNGSGIQIDAEMQKEKFQYQFPDARKQFPDSN